MILKTFNQFIRIDSRFNVDDILLMCSKMDDFFSNPLVVLKDDSTSTVILSELNGQKYVIKRANTKNIAHIFKRALKTSRAQKNWDNARRLNKIGIPAIQAIAMMEERWGIFKGRSYFVCPYIDGVDARQFFARDAQPNTTWATVAQNICTMIQTLAQHKLSHRDLNLSNIILVSNVPYLIDLDAMTHYKIPWVASWAAKKEQRRFMQNWQNDPKPHNSAAKLFQALLS
tara:strand:+ start:11371 stop:12057 length:687 start_codon:yes stop_codon:yes gene_type:complete